MKLSLIIPNYNSNKYIIECFNSLENQTFKDFEVIIIDDGSKKEDLEIINNYIKNTSLNVKLICQNNQNAAIARNRGIEIAKGEYFYFLDSDDRLTNEKSLEIMINSIKDNDLLIGNYNIIDTQSKKIGEYNYKNDINSFNNNYCFVDTSPVPSNKLYKRTIIKENNIYFSNVRIAQDLNFFLKYLCHCKKVGVINECIYDYRILNNSMSRKINLNFLDIYNSLMEVKKYYILNQKEEEFINYVDYVCIKHMHNQASKVKFFRNRKFKRSLLGYFDYCLNDFKYQNVFIKKQLRIYKIKKYLIFLNLYDLVKKIER